MDNKKYGLWLYRVIVRLKNGRSNIPISGSMNGRSNQMEFSYAQWASADGWLRLGSDGSIPYVYESEKTKAIDKGDLFNILKEKYNI